MVMPGYITRDVQCKVHTKIRFLTSSSGFFLDMISGHLAISHLFFAESFVFLSSQVLHNDVDADSRVPLSHALRLHAFLKHSVIPYFGSTSRHVGHIPYLSEHGESFHSFDTSPAPHLCTYKFKYILRLNNFKRI